VFGAAFGAAFGGASSGCVCGVTVTVSLLPGFWPLLFELASGAAFSLFDGAFAAGAPFELSSEPFPPFIGPPL
jgi:hypothetical protein